MSERDDDGCLNLLAGVIAVAVAVVIMWIVTNEINKRDNWIRDLQRRVGQLEQQRR